MFVFGGILFTIILVLYITGVLNIMKYWLRWRFRHRKINLIKPWLKGYAQKRIEEMGPDWQVIEAHPEFMLVKAIRFRPQFRDEDMVLLLGQDIHTGQDFSLRCPPSYLNKSIEDCRRWCINVGRKELIEV